MAHVGSARQQAGARGMVKWSALVPGGTLVAGWEQPQARFGSGDALRFAWRTVTGRFLFFAAALIAVELFYRGFNTGLSWLLAPVWYADTIHGIINWTVGVTVSILSIRVALKLIDGERMAWTDVRQTPGLLVRFAAASLVYVGAIVGLVLAAHAAAFAIAAEFLNVRSTHRHFSLPASIAISALGAVALVVCLGGGGRQLIAGSTHTLLWIADWDRGQPCERAASVRAVCAGNCWA